MTVVYGSPFGLDWFSKDSVIKYATSLGHGVSVVKYPGRSNYNITHTTNEGRLPDGVEIVHRT